MSILNSTYNSFIFNFTKNFIPENVTSRWEPYVKRTPTPYDTVTHFLNSTIQSVSFPPINMDIVQQNKKVIGKFPKERDFKNSKLIDDLFTRELTITFKTTEGFANYWIMQEVLISYLDFQNKQLYLEDFYLRMIDQDGYILSSVVFKEVIFTGLSGINLSYADNVPEFKSFDATFKFNFIDINVTTGAEVYKSDNTVKETTIKT
jgi:hypothetical protein